MELGPCVAEGGNFFFFFNNGMAQNTSGRKIHFQGEYYAEISCYLAVLGAVL